MGVGTGIALYEIGIGLGELVDKLHSHRHPQQQPLAASQTPNWNRNAAGVPNTPGFRVLASVYKQIDSQLACGISYDHIFCQTNNGWFAPVGGRLQSIKLYGDVACGISPADQGNKLWCTGNIRTETPYWIDMNRYNLVDLAMSNGFVCVVDSSTNVYCNTTPAKLDTTVNLFWTPIQGINFQTLDMWGDAACGILDQRLFCSTNMFPNGVPTSATPIQQDFPEIPLPADTTFTSVVLGGSFICGIDGKTANIYCFDLATTDTNKQWTPYMTPDVPQSIALGSGQTATQLLGVSQATGELYWTAITQ